MRRELIRVRGGLRYPGSAAIGYMRSAVRISASSEHGRGLPSRVNAVAASMMAARVLFR